MKSIISLCKTLFILLTIIGVSACNNGDKGLLSQQLPESVTELIVTPQNNTIAVGLTQQFKAEAELSNGQVITVTEQHGVTWSSSDESIATISNDGIATGKAIGVVTITATGEVNGDILTSTATLEITDEVVTALTITPNTVSTPIGLTASFNAFATLSNGQTIDVTNSPLITWSSSDDSIATITNTDDGKGIATGKSSGSVTITAIGEVNQQTFTATATLNVTDAIVTALAITSDNSSVPVGLTTNFNAFATFSNGQTLDVTDSALINWSSSDSTIATISNIDDSKGLATGESVGVVTISATGEINGQTFAATTILEVSNEIVTALTVTPDIHTTPIGFTKSFNAFVTLSNGETLDVTHSPLISWTSSDHIISTVSNTHGSKGIVKGESVGSVTITASGTVNEQTFSATATLEVTSEVVTALSINPKTQATPVGLTKAFYASATLSNGQTIDVTNSALISWSSSDNTIASISNIEGSKGVATGEAIGTATITAIKNVNGETFSTTATLEVTSEVVTALSITPDTATTPVGLTATYHAFATLSDGQTIDVTHSPFISWSSSDNTIASITNVEGSKGVATGEAIGVATITATGIVNGQTFSATATLEVTNEIVTALEITPNTQSIPVNLTTSFNAIITLSNGETIDVTNSPLISWSSSDNSIATISNTDGSKGVATGVSVGSVTITAEGTTNGQTFSATAGLTVSGPSLTKLELSPENLMVNIGFTQNLTAMATYADNSIVNVTNSVTWASKDTSKATVSSDGTVTGISEGYVDITATIDGVTTAINLRVCTLENCLDIFDNGTGKLFTSSPSRTYVNAIGLSSSDYGDTYEEKLETAAGITFAMFTHTQAVNLCNKYNTLQLRGRTNWTLSPVDEYKALYSMVGNMLYARGWPITSIYRTSYAKTTIQMGFSNYTSSAIDGDSTVYVSCTSEPN